MHLARAYYKPCQTSKTQLFVNKSWICLCWVTVAVKILNRLDFFPHFSVTVNKIYLSYKSPDNLCKNGFIVLRKIARRYLKTVSFHNMYRQATHFVTFHHTLQHKIRNKKWCVSLLTTLRKKGRLYEKVYNLFTFTKNSSVEMHSGMILMILKYYVILCYIKYLIPCYLRDFSNKNSKYEN